MFLTFQNISETTLINFAKDISPIFESGDILALSGDLGAGKSTFARAFIRHKMENEEEDVPSPTYTLVQQYCPPDPKTPEVWHFDLYRLDHPEDAIELGIEDAFEEVISLIEWPQKLGHLLPEDCLILKLTMGDNPNCRTLELFGDEVWEKRLNKVTIKT